MPFGLGCSVCLRPSSLSSSCSPSSSTGLGLTGFQCGLCVFPRHDRLLHPSRSSFRRWSRLRRTEPSTTISFLHGENLQSTSSARLLTSIKEHPFNDEQIGNICIENLSGICARPNGTNEFFDGYGASLLTYCPSDDDRYGEFRHSRDRTFLTPNQSSSTCSKANAPRFPVLSPIYRAASRVI
jgi:hypothetical protein